MNTARPEDLDPQITRAITETLDAIKRAIGNVRLIVLDDLDQGEHTQGILDGLALVEAFLDSVAEATQKENNK